MKRIIAVILSFVLIGAHAGNSYGQEKAKDKIAEVKEKSGVVSFTISSSKPFIFGNNAYVLYIGGKDFTRSIQAKKNGKGLITFFIPVSEFSNLKEGAGIFLNYGAADPDDDMEALAKHSRRCWALGRFSRAMLTR